MKPKSAMGMVMMAGRDSLVLVSLITVVVKQDGERRTVDDVEPSPPRETVDAGQVLVRRRLQVL